MASPAVTYTLTNGSTADASQVMQNFNDIITALTDGSKSLSIDALTCAGAATFQGNVTLGNGTPDDITISGSLASDILIKTNNSYNFGGSTLGLASIYLGAPPSRTTRLRSNQSIAGSLTFILPATVGNSGDYIEGDGTGGLSMVSVRRSPNTASNYGLSTSIGSNQLTITMTGADGSAISSSNPVHVVSRNATQTTGTPTVQTLTSTPTSIVLPNGATLGHASGQNQYVYVYLIFGSATEIAVCGQPLTDEMSLQSASAVSSGSTSGTTLYATSNHTSKPVRYVGRLKSNQSAAGTWASTMAEVSLASYLERNEISEMVVYGGNGHGSTNTKIRRFTIANAVTTGSAITLADSSTNGCTIAINENGLYSMTYQDSNTGAAYRIGFSLNSSQLTTNVDAITSADILATTTGSNAVGETQVSATRRLRAGDIVRAHTDGTPNATGNICRFAISKLTS